MKYYNFDSDFKKKLNFCHLTFVETSVTYSEKERCALDQTLLTEIVAGGINAVHQWV
jgi:hypothetical protein